MVANQGYLLATMRMGVKDHWFDGRPAESLFAPLPIYPTPARTEPTFLKDSVRLLYPLSQFPLGFQLFIGRTPSFAPFLGSIEGDRRDKERATYQERAFDKIPTGDIHPIGPIS